MRNKFLLGGLRNGDLKFLILMMALSILCVSTIGLLIGSIKSGLENEGNTLLGGDKAISALQPISRDKVEKAMQLGLKKSETLSFLSMLTHQDALTLADIKAIDEAYPLRGVLKSSTQIETQTELFGSIPEAGTIWLSPDLFTLLNLKINDVVLIGEQAFKVTRVLILDAVLGSEGLMLAPRALINKKDVIKTGVIQAGSRQTYTLLVSGSAPQLAQFTKWIVPKLLPTETLNDPKNARPMMHHWLKQGQYYLNVMLCMNWLLASATIFQAARHFSSRQFKTVAILRCFGSSFRWIMQRFFMEAILLSLLGGMIGFFLGFLVAFFSRPALQYYLQQPITWNWIDAIALSLLTMIILFLCFSLPPLWALRKVTPLHIMRNIHSIPLQEPKGVMGLIRRKYIRIIGRLGIVIRYGLSNCFRSPIQSGIQIIVFTLVMLCAWVVYLIRTDLLHVWAHQIPPNAPNYFAINISPEDVQKFKIFLDKSEFVYSNMYPIVRARLVAVNNEPVEIGVSTDTHVRSLYRLLNLTYDLNLPLDNKIIAGKWFSKDEVGESIVSVEKDFANRLQIQMRDRLRFQIGDEIVDARVNSIRTVEWSTLHPNFYIMFPPKVIDHFTQSYMTSFYVSSENRSALKSLVKEFPSVNLLNVSMELKHLFSILSRLTLVIESFWGFIVIMAFMLLWCAIQINKAERFVHVALFRALGASSAKIFTLVISEFCLLGFTSGLIAVILANGIFAWLSLSVLELPYMFNWHVLSMGPLIGMVLVGICGALSLREIRLASPRQLLSAR